MLWAIFGPKREVVTGYWRQLHNELHALYSLPNTIRLVRLRRGDGQGMWHVLGGKQMHTGIWWGKLNEREYLEDLSINGN